MPEYKWPEADQRSLIGKRISRLDGPVKVTGQAKYTYDINRPGMLYGKIVRSPHAHARIVSVDTSAAEKMPGVKAVKVLQGPGVEIYVAGDEDSPPAADQTAGARGVEIHWAGDEVVALAAVDESTAEDAARAIKVEYEVLPHLVDDTDPKRAGDRAKPATAQVQGDPDSAFASAEVTSEGVYGSPVITHCCLEPHGAVSEWEDQQNLLVHISTQNVSGIAGQMAAPLGIPAGNIRVKQDHIGGGFGSKFSPDRWGVATAELSKLAGGAPVKIMLERDAELMVAGARPSAYARVKLAAKKDGTLTGWHSESWGSGGFGGGGSPPLPYIFNIPHQRKQHTAISTNIGSARAWRAPNHPQACLITMAAFDDLAARLNMDPMDFFLKNIDLTGPRAIIYRDEFPIAAEMMGWKQKWHPRGDKSAGPVKRGLGLAIHTWGGRGHASDCDLTIHPDGSVELKMGTQDLGVGTRTVLAIVAADTFGLPIDAIKVLIGDNRYPVSGGSGGSTTVGGVSSSTRRASQDALEQLFIKVAPALKAQPAELHARGGFIQVASDTSRRISWKDACAKLGALPLTVRGKNPGEGKLTDSGVGGVQMAEVTVDVETGIVKMQKFVTVQDCGLVVDLKTAESQVYGAMIMGVAYALYEEKVMDSITGRMLNPNMEFYRLAHIGDIGEFQVRMMTGKGYDDRGVIGLGEPPVVGPGAAISNAVANAIGVRVPHLPLTPDRVLQALQSQKGATNAAI